MIPLLLFVVFMGLGAINTSAQTLAADSQMISKLPSLPFLPNPLIIDEGGKNIPVQTPAQWKEKRRWIKDRYQYWVSGAVPPAPKAFKAKILADTVQNGVKLRTIALYFGPGDSGQMTLELMIPPGEKPLPVFMTQWNHRAWARVAVERGYIGCVYAGADAKDDSRNYNEIYPGYDFATLMKRAWGSSRVIDYLYTLPAVDTNRIALAGHSRNGKQSLMAAAFDDRIKAVVSSSGGTGGEMTFRYSDERFDSESLEEITRNFPYWFSPRLRLFTGREQKLPVDQNSLMSLIAPRGLMMVSAITEHQGNPWGIEQSYKSVKSVYHFLDADSNIAILLRRGRHQHAAREIEDYLDFCDYIFGRSPLVPHNKLYYDYSFKKWKKLSGEQIDPFQFSEPNGQAWEKLSDKQAITKEQDSVRSKINWLLGEKPPLIPGNKTFSPFLGKNSTYKDDYLSEVIGQVHFRKADSIEKMRFGPYSPLGDDLWGTVFYPSGSVKDDSVVEKLPLVIYLHEYSYATGYHRRSAGIIRHFLSAGYAVLAYDMSGFGTRIEEALHFYDRYPHWSKMGKMVSDTRSIVGDVCNRMPFIDTENIYLAGYSLGGTVALITAALDKRIKGVAAVAAFSSLRKDNKGTEGIRHFYQLHGLLPKLGFFAGQVQRIPVDFDDILSCIAPRPLLVIAPGQDRHHSISAVDEVLSRVSQVYEKTHASRSLSIRKPETYNHFTIEMQQEVTDWLRAVKKMESFAY